MSITIEATDTDLQHKLITQAEKRLPYLTAGETYTLAAILGETFWEENDEESHKAQGRIFSGLVNDRRVPFTADGWTKYRHNEYRYTPTE
ncbi:MAG: hypothetical protein H6992_13845 [Pseudomonadales bacterium]|nr:hypothetical protein [Pseudomonadales bacterium]